MGNRAIRVDLLANFGVELSMDTLQMNMTLALGPLRLRPEDLMTTTASAEPAFAALKQRMEAGELPAFGAALQMPEATRRAVAGWAERFNTVLLLGMGGSSLGGKLISQFADPLGMQAPRVLFVDCLDPMALRQALDLPLEQVGVIAISKSGGTLETLTQVRLLLTEFGRRHLPVAEHWRVVTEPTENPLRALAEQHGIPALAHEARLGGRYSIAAETGAIPALLKGLDMEAVHAGMRPALDAWHADPLGSPAALGAALQARAAAGGKSLTVLYAYGEKWRGMPGWFEQLWAESLGKNGQGTTPLGAFGPASQHSLQQLFLAGPEDKLFTVLIPKTQGVAVAGEFPPTGTLQWAMAQGTVRALAARGHPVRVLEVDDTPLGLGQALMHLMLETVLTAALWGVNPFDQPAVEESKQQALAVLRELHTAAGQDAP